MTHDTVDEELRELQRDYLRDLRDKMTLIRQHTLALRDGARFKTSFPVLLFLVHQLKGSGGSMGFPRISELAREIGQHLNQFLDDSAPRPSPEALSTTLLAMTAELEAAVKEGGKTIR